MAKRPLYPTDVTRKYNELPSDASHRTTPEKLEAADALEAHWSDGESFKSIAARDDLSVGKTTVGRAFWQFFGPNDEDLTFVELGEKYQDPLDEDADWKDGLDDYLEARKNDRLEEFKRARKSTSKQSENGDTPQPLNARELELCRRFYQRGVQDVLDELGLEEDDLAEGPGAY